MDVDSVSKIASMMPKAVVGRGKWLTLIELFGSHRAARTVA